MKDKWEHNYYRTSMKMHYVMYHSKHATDHENHKNTKM